MIKSRVKVMLAMREMTQKELAEATGVRPPTISAICTDAARLSGFFYRVKSDKVKKRKTKIIGVHSGCIPLKTEFWGAWVGASRHLFSDKIGTPFVLYSPMKESGFD